jgi:hypothetical protein
MKTNNQPSGDCFLETSVPRQILFGHSLIKEEIGKCLRNCTQKRSSFYVLMEYKRSVVKTLIDLYFVAKEEKTPSDALHYFQEGFRTRQNKIVLSAVATLLEDSGIANDKLRFLVKLETLIFGSFQYFHDLIDKYIENKTGCPLGKISIQDEVPREEAYRKFLEEIDCIRFCSLDKFLKSKKSHLKRLIEEGEKAPHDKNKGFQEALLLIKSAIGTLDALKAKTNCMKIGDIIIALEVPKRLQMLTFDRGFESSCQILGKRLIVLPSLATLRKSRASAPQLS